MIWGFQKSENGKPDKFDSAGEAIAYISLDQAVLTARRLVREDEERYHHRLGWDTIVWTETDSEQREDSYRVVLQFRRPERGLREEQTGEEEFIFDLTGGLQDRQVLLWPEPTEKVRLLTPPPETPPPQPNPPVAQPATSGKALFSEIVRKFLFLKFSFLRVLPMGLEWLLTGRARRRQMWLDRIVGTISGKKETYSSTDSCLHCGAEVQPKDDFCTVCGLGLRGDT